jgi:hypothetical protein
MGSVADDSEPEDPIWGQLMSPDDSPSKSQPAAKPAAIANRSINGTGGSAPTVVAPAARPLVQPASHYEWKPSASHEPDANQSTGPTAGAAASR